MGVKKTMDTFFASMQEQSMSGYSGRLVNTPMGPFRWNDTMQLWENVNNGMVMNNISFQDSIMMLDYSTIDGGLDSIPTISGGDVNRVLFINFNNETIGNVTFSRSTTGRFIGSNRFLGLTGINVPRFNYYPEGTTGGLLIEDTSRNILTSSSIANPSWQGNSYYDEIEENYIPLILPAAITGITSPLGITSSVRISAVGNTTGRHYMSTVDSFNATTGQTFTASLWAKSSGNTFNRYLGLVCDGNQARAMFDLQDNTYQAYTATNVFAKIVPYINDWKRIEMTWISPSTGLFSMWVVPHVSMVDPINTYYAEDGNTSGFFISSIQLENNSSASSFMAVGTLLGGVTRGNDLAYFEGTGFTWFNGSCGTFVFEFDKKTAGHTADNIKTRTVMGINYDSSNNYGIALDYIIGSTVASIRAANGNMLLNNSGLTNGMNKVSFSYNNNGSQMEVVSSVNGSTTQSQSPDIGDFNISGATFMTLGYKQALVGTTAYDYLDTTIRSVQYWNKALSGASLQQLST